MPDVILIDPLGRQIILHERTWFGHILKRHPELATRKLQVEQAVLFPLEVRFSLSDSNCRTYYGLGHRAGMMVPVVANVVDAYMKTAFTTDRTKGALEWSRPKP